MAASLEQAGDHILQLLVVGPVGAGKSSLIRDHVPQSAQAKPSIGASPRGVTKAVRSYPGQLKDGTSVVWIDSSGVGDQDVKPWEVVSQIESEVRSDIDGLIIALPCGGRFDTGVQVVQLLLRRGFLQKTLSDCNVILLGTKSDIAFMLNDATGEETTFDERQELIDAWRHEVVAEFHADSQTKIERVAVVSRRDYSELTDCLRNLPSRKARIGKVDTRETAVGLAKIFGLDTEEVFTSFMHVREEMQARSLERLVLRVKARVTQLHEKAINDFISKMRGLIASPERKKVTCDLSWVWRANAMTQRHKTAARLLQAALEIHGAPIGDTDMGSANAESATDISHMVFAAIRKGLPQEVQAASLQITLGNWDQGIEVVLTSLKQQISWLDVTLVMAKLATWSHKIIPLVESVPRVDIQRNASEICQVDDTTFPVMGANGNIHVLDFGMSTICLRAGIVCGWSLWITMHIRFWVFESVEDFVRTGIDESMID